MEWRKIFAVILCALIGTCTSYGPWPSAFSDPSNDQCDTAIKEIILEDRATLVVDSTDRLQGTWLSQECEVRTGPEYVIRKYTFYENGTFLLIRHHYAEESCSVATHTVAARGAIRLLSSSGSAPGATEARYQLDRVHIVPLTRQVAHKFGHRVNITCTPQPRWRPYFPHTIYEQPSKHFPTSMWESPSFNSFQRPGPTRKHRSLDCLEPLGIDFNELKLIRVQRKPSSAFSQGGNDESRVELFLGSLPPNSYTRKSYRSTSLQSNGLLRSDTIKGCLVCRAISHGTESSPPLLHEVANLPALLGGSWISQNCESCEGGLWIKRQLQIYSGDLLWTGRWDYYSDPKCTNFLYAVTAAGSYIQRAGRQRRHDVTERDFDELPEIIIDYPIEEIEKLDIPHLHVGDRRRRNVQDPAMRQLENDKLRSSQETVLKSIENGMKTEYLPIFKNKPRRARREIPQWMQPDMAKKLLDIYGDNRNMRAAMLPTIKFDFQKPKEPETTTESTTLPTTTQYSPRNPLNTPSEFPSELPTKYSLQFSPKFYQKISEELSTKNSPEVSSETSPTSELPTTSEIPLEVSTESSEEPTEFSLNLSEDQKKLLFNFNPRRTSIAEDSYRHLLDKTQPSLADSFAAMLRGNQRREETTKKPLTLPIPTGTTELDLHVAESMLIAGDLSIAARCGAQIVSDGGHGLRVKSLSSWPRNCVKHALESPSTLGLRARVGVSWSGQYTLLLGPRDDNLWEAPLRQCGRTSKHNPGLRQHLRQSLGYRYGLFTSSGASGAQVGLWTGILLAVLVQALVA